MDSKNLPVIDPNIKNVGDSTSNYFRDYCRHHLFAVIIFSLIFIILTVGYEILLFIFFPNHLKILLLYFLPLLPLIGGYNYMWRRVQHEFMRQFALAKGFNYSARGRREGLAGFIFQIGRRQLMTDVITGQYNNYPLALFSYSYVTGHGKAHQRHNYTIFKIQLRTKMPNILLKNKSQSFSESLFLKQSQAKNSLQLEGNFNQYFTLSVSTGYARQALEIFTPDLMVELIDKARWFSLEIIDDQLFIYYSGLVSTKEQLLARYELSCYFFKKLEPILTRIC